MDRCATEVKLSDSTTVEIEALDALESIKADNLIGNSESQALANKVYAICSIRKLNGEAVFPLKNQGEFETLAKRLTMAEVIKLGLAVDDANPLPEDLKKELAARLKSSSQDS